ncbi:MAG: hypothetical protein QNJ46_29165 [Leptolyngbyaceae cyanobacterium MO_188.B28]|nr:hypothetical protein [Leptolyngbyaceae cyanobacterium MO_188.B28]
MQRSVLFPSASEPCKPQKPAICCNLRVRPIETWLHQHCIDQSGVPATLAEAILLHDHPDIQATLAVLEHQANAILSQMRKTARREDVLGELG